MNHPLYHHLSLEAELTFFFEEILELSIIFKIMDKIKIKILERAFPILVATLVIEIHFSSCII